MPVAMKFYSWLDEVRVPAHHLGACRTPLERYTVILSYERYTVILSEYAYGATIRMSHRGQASRQYVKAHPRLTKANLIGKVRILGMSKLVASHHSCVACPQ